MLTIACSGSLSLTLQRPLKLAVRELQMGIDKEKREVTVFDERSKKAIEYFLKLIINISLASVALYFITLTKNIEPLLTETQITTLVVGLTFMSLSIFCALGFVAYEYGKNHLRVIYLLDKSDKSADEYHSKVNMWRPYKKIAVFIMVLSFISGLGCSVIFIYLRLVSA